MGRKMIYLDDAINAICREGTRLERNGTVAMVEIKQWCVDLLEDLPSAQPDKDMLHLQREQAYMQGWEDACKGIRLANIPSPHKEQNGLHSSTVSRIYDRGWQDGQNALREERNDKTGSD